MITFPFLFAVMYGDVFHGCFLLGLALILIGFQSKLKQITNKGEVRCHKPHNHCHCCVCAVCVLFQIFQAMFAGRYVLLFMGLFAIFCGLIYNDVMSISVFGV